MRGSAQPPPFSVFTMTAPEIAPPKRRRGRPSHEEGTAIALIRRAALREFALAGFAGVSIADIARAAGVAKPLIHYHFESKDALWEAAVSEGFLALQHELASFRVTLSAGSGPETLRLLAHQLVRYAARYPELTRIVIQESGSGGERWQWLLHTYLLPAYRLAQLAIESFRAVSSQPQAVPAAAHVIPVVLGMMSFPFLETEVIREAFGVDVQSEGYLQEQGEVLFRVMGALV
jgi:TetR/AcrR family transcriptional regulator